MTVLIVRISVVLAGSCRNTIDNLKHSTIACEECRETFTRKSTLEEHIRNRQQVSCDECSQTFCYQSRLLDHRKKMHASIACEECGKMINKKYMDVHKSWSHK